MPLIKCILKTLTQKSVIQNSLFRNVRNLIEVSIKMDSAKMFHTSGIKFAPTKESNFKFTNYDCIGFDLDNTVCRFKIGAMAKLEYDLMCKFLIEKKGYPSKHLLQPFEEHLDFMIKGLIIDSENGNILKIKSDGTIESGSHGTKQLSKQQIIEYYGEECRWHAIDLFSKDPLHTWNGPYVEMMRSLLDYFDIVVGLVFARAVDGLDESSKRKIQKYSVWPDLLDALIDMFQKEHFHLGKGGYFPELKANPEKYIYKCSDNLLKWFHELRARNISLFLITGSNVDFASHTAGYTLGPNWRNFFDIVVCFAKKPGFFTGDRKFIGLDGIVETGPVEASNLKAGEIYTLGNFKDLHNFLQRHTGKENPKMLYIGDNLIQDVYTPAVHTVCDTVAVVEELQAEGKFGHASNHIDYPIIVSSIWGSYFGSPDEHDSFWHDIIKKHSKLCIPNLEYVSNFPVDHPYYSSN